MWAPISARLRASSIKRTYPARHLANNIKPQQPIRHQANNIKLQQPIRHQANNTNNINKLPRASQHRSLEVGDGILSANATCLEAKTSATYPGISQASYQK